MNEPWSKVQPCVYCQTVISTDQPLLETNEGVKVYGPRIAPPECPGCRTPIEVKEDIRGNWQIVLMENPF